MALPSFGLKMLVKKSCSFCHRRFLCEESAFDLPGKPRPSGCILGPAHVTDTQGWALWVALWWLQVVTICYRKIGRTCGSSPFSWNDITMIWQFDIHKNPEAMVGHDPSLATPNLPLRLEKCSSEIARASQPAVTFHHREK